MADLINPLGTGGVAGPQPLSPSGPASPGKAEGKSFKDILTQQIGDVNKLQEEANAAAERLATGQTNNVEEVMLAAKKAELAFDAMMQIRNKIMDAFDQLMQMRV